MFGYHIDLKRAMWRREYLETYLARLARWGFDTIVLEIEDKLTFHKHPAIAHPDALSHAAMRDVLVFCESQGLNVIPLVQTLGHAEYVLSKREYRPLREVCDNDSQYNTRSAAARSVVIDLLDETIDVMRPRQCFHMGGDEARLLGAGPAARELASAKGKGYLYLQHMLPLIEHVHQRGLRPILWADMALRHPEILPDLPRYVVLMDWDYWTRDARASTVHLWNGNPHTGEAVRLTWDEYRALDNSDAKRLMDPFAVDDRTPVDGTFRTFCNVGLLRSMGFDVITASANRFANAKTGIPLHETHIPNCFWFTRRGFDEGMGTLVTSWAVRHGHPETVHPATFAAVLAQRGATECDIDDIGRQFTAEYYGTSFPAFTMALIKAGRAFSMGRAASIANARKTLRDGGDPLSHELAHLRKAVADGVFPDPAVVLNEYREAREAFVEMRDHAPRNAHNLDFWIEGIDLDTFYLRFMQAAMEGALQKHAVGMLKDLHALRERSRRLLAESYTPRGVDAELDQRYGFHEEYLANRCKTRLVVRHGSSSCVGYT